MKRFSSLALIFIFALTISACGVRAAQVTPTAVDIQGSAVAAAFTIVAQTQAAIPTATPIPPTATFTNIPAVVDTLPPLPSTPITATPAPNSNSGSGDPCISTALPRSLQGKTVKMRIDNSTKVTVSITVYLNQTAPGGQCGYRSYTLDSGQFLVINDLVEGCYTLWAWNPDPQNYFIVTNGTSCLDTSDNWLFDISTSNIQLRR